MTQHTISLLVANKPGVLLRIALIFSRRGFNIESLVVCAAMDGNFSRMTITALGDPETLEQIIKQAAKLVDVLSASEHLDDAFSKELALIKVKTASKRQAELLQLVEHFKAQAVEMNPESTIIQMTADSDKIDSMINMLKQFEILELVRTGKVMITKGLEKT